MNILQEGLSAFLQAVGIAALLWVLCALLPHRKKKLPDVCLCLSGDGAGIDEILRRLRGLQVRLRDEGLNDEGRRRVHLAARREGIDCEEENRHGGENHH